MQHFLTPFRQIKFKNAKKKKRKYIISPRIYLRSIRFFTHLKIR